MKASNFFQNIWPLSQTQTQKRTHTRASYSQANGWLSTSGDDQEVLWNTREPMETNLQNMGENNTFCALPDCPDWGGGLSAAELPDCPRQGTDCPPVKVPKTHKLESDLTWAKDTAADCPWRTSGLSGGKMRRRTVTGTDSVRC
jgi:hypothetical protein